MAFLHVSDVQTWDHRFGEHLAGFALETPGTGFTGDTFRMPLRGYVVGKGAPVEWVQVSGVEFPAVRLPVTQPRPDVAEAFPDKGWAATAGFEGGVSAIKLDSSFKLHVLAILGDGTKLPVGHIVGRWQPPAVEGHARLQPLIVTTLGRTGSTWFTGLLSQHPEVFVLRPYHYEPRAAWYWMDVLGSLSESHSYQQLIAPEAYGQYWWLGNERRLPQNQMEKDPDLKLWLETGYAEQLRHVCRDQIDKFYNRVAPVERFPRAHYFVEKVWPGSSSQAMLAGVYPGMREVFLIRDFRDMACSVSAYGRKLGFHGFGREFVQSDEDYVAGPLLDNALAMAETWRRRSDRAHLLRYEDLVQDPRSALGELLPYLEVDASPAVIERMITGGVDEEAQRDHQTAPSVADSVGRWRKELTEPVRRVFEESYDEILAGFGYAQS